MFGKKNSSSPDNGWGQTSGSSSQPSGSWNTGSSQPSGSWNTGSSQPSGSWNTGSSQPSGSWNTGSSQPSGSWNTGSSQPSGSWSTGDPSQTPGLWNTGDPSQTPGSWSQEPVSPGRITFDTQMLVVCLILCAIGSVIGLFFYGLTELPRIIKIGLITLLSGGLPLCGAAVLSVRRKNGRKLRPGSGRLLPLMLAVLFGAGALMQFLYNVGTETVAAPIDEYIFVIDDSGSMAQTDPNNERLSSLRYMLEQIDEDKTVGLVCFTERITHTIPPVQVTQTHIQNILNTSSNLASSGGTDIHQALEHALNLCDPNLNSMVVLLTDGFSQYTVRLHSLTDICRNSNTIISTIGLSSNIDVNLLQRLADMTGGTFYNITELDKLADIYSRINIIDYSRDLLGIRPVDTNSNFWLALLRVFSWTLFGALIGFSAILLLDHSVYPYLQPAVSTAGGLLLGLLLELLNSLWIELTLMRLPLLLLLGLIVCFFRLQAKAQPVGFTPAAQSGTKPVNTQKDSLQNKQQENENWIGRL